MAARSKREIDQEAEANRRKLLAAELVAVALLFRRRDAAVSSGLRAGSGTSRIADKLEFGLRRAVAELRQLSRLAGLTRLRSELTSVGLDVRTGRGMEDEVGRDALRARRWASSYAERWQRNAIGETPRGAARTANQATASNVRLAATTESSEAFNTGRAKALRRLSAFHLLRVWDAVLDRRTCPRCLRAEGTIVGIYENFPDGEPGAVHPRCRCSFTVLTAEEAGSVLNIEAA